MHDNKLKKLEAKAQEIRIDLMKTLAKAGSGHSAGPLGSADIWTAFYFHILKHDPKNPDWEKRDRLFLSAGHYCPVQYVCMAHAGYFPMKELRTLRKPGSRLQGHPERTALPGIENTSGPLGDGIAQAVGCALAAKMDKARWRTYCFISDGELECGIDWEAFLVAPKFNLSNLTVVLDRNNIQIDGSTEDVCPLEPLRDKFEAFNWHVIEVDGHNIREFVDAVGEAKSVQERPTIIIAHTIPGKGVDFMENDHLWHGKPPGKGTELKAAIKSLEEYVD
jgi:transketolase